VRNSTTGDSLAAYWKDGTLNYLPLNSGYTGSEAGYLAEDSSGNIYVLSTQWSESGQPTLFGYWRNGT